MAAGKADPTNSLTGLAAGEAGELRGARGGLEPHYRRCLGILGRMRPSELRQRQAFIDRATAELGMHTDRVRMAPESLGSFGLDLFPRILRPAEWARVEAGVLQRARAFSAYVRDIHNGREILHAGIIRPERVFEDPAFHPELHGVPMAEPGPVLVGAIDLLRTPAGEWQVLENRLSTPTGIAYVIQIRRIMAQALPELFEQVPVFPVASFATRLSEALAEHAGETGGGRPLTVLLSEGETGRHFFEESFLARHMGIPLARTADIVVRDGRVFLKTIAGLLAIDVIHRRMEPPLLDPVAFASGTGSGVPGLIQCVRRGTVRIVNALGCAVADNRALLRHSGAIIRFYTGEQPILPTVPTYSGYDRDEAEWIQDHLGSVALKTVCHPESLRHARPEAGRLFDRGDLEGIFRADPRLVVAQQLPECARLPVYRDGVFTAEALSMRVFFILGKRPHVLPGGMTRLFTPGNETLPAGHRFHALKDTWSLGVKRSETARSGRLERSISTGLMPLPSRAAEACYWIGRYLERARGTARMLNILEELRWDELVPGERELNAPLWAGLIKATGQQLKGRAGRPADAGRLARALLLDTANPASVRCCLASVRWNASCIRSFITPEFWRSIQDACALLETGFPGRLRGTRLREFTEGVVDAGDRVFGAGQRTLLHDPGWQFINLGLSLERAVTHVVILDEVLPHIARRQLQHLRDDTDLTALLRLLGALDAYHRRYRSRAYLDRVAELLWQAPACTASVLFATRSIHQILLTLAGEVGGGPATLLEEVDAFANWLAAIPLGEIFPARARELDSGLTPGNLAAARTIEQAQLCLARMRGFLEGLHGRLEDRYFSHHPETREGSA